ncbi:MAG: hypothetical protein QME60_08155 [Verrucomicrobiota bacterium]|nr:hypothetical protein [Verrucomicrobiota bacterium]
MGAWFARALCGLLLLPGPAMAQLKILIALKHSEFLQYEPLPVKVVLENNDTRPFVVARDAAPIPDLQFVFDRLGAGEARRRKEGVLLKNLYTLPGKKEELEINVGDWHDVSATGQYLMKVVVKWGGREYASNQVVFDVVPGIPLAGAVKKAPVERDRMRTYSLRYWRRDRGEQLFLCVTEEETKMTFGVFPLGGLVRVHNPTIEIGAGGTVMIRHQVSATCFARTLLESTADAVRLVKQTFHMENGDPYPVLQGASDEKNR